MQLLFIDYLGYLISATEVRTVSTVSNREWEGIHISYRHGGFTNIAGGSKDEFLALVLEAQKALAPF